MTWTSMVAVGRVVRPHGNRGQVVVAPETDFPEDRFRVGETVFMCPSSDPEPLAVRASRRFEDRWIVGFAGVDSIDAAEMLRGRELRIPAETIKTLDLGRHYVHDLVGCRVRTVAGEDIGEVARVEMATGVPTVVVAADGGDEVLVPFIDAICRRVDTAERVIEIDPPEGLIDLNRGGPR